MTGENKAMALFSPANDFFPQNSFAFRTSGKDTLMDLFPVADKFFN